MLILVEPHGVIQKRHTYLLIRIFKSVFLLIHVLYIFKLYRTPAVITKGFQVLIQCIWTDQFHERMFSILFYILMSVMFSLGSPGPLLFIYSSSYTLLLWGAYCLHEKSSCDHVGCSAFTNFSLFCVHAASFCNVLPMSFKLCQFLLPASFQFNASYWPQLLISLVFPSPSVKLNI